MESMLFFILASFILVFALGVLFAKNPVVSALSLAAVMIALSALFFDLGAYFLAAVQVAVYAGAVMVLFVMVIMLFDLHRASLAEPHSVTFRFLKTMSVGIVLGVIAGIITLSGFDSSTQKEVANSVSSQPTKELAHLLFEKYLFGFEVLGALLLVVAIGVVSVSRIKGGTHARS